MLLLLLLLLPSIGKASVRRSMVVSGDVEAARLGCQGRNERVTTNAWLDGYGWMIRWMDAWIDKLVSGIALIWTKHNGMELRVLCISMLVRAVHTNGIWCMQHGI
jgi:hypothetical protein